MKPIFTLMAKLIAKTYWNHSNAQWMSLSKTQGAVKVKVWCEVRGNNIFGHISFDTNPNAEAFLNFLQDTKMSSLLNEEGEFPAHS
jgi:hypothetical protein